MDSSDGLSTTLIEMAKQSKRKFIIKKIPTGNDIIEFAKSQNIVVDDLVFNGGEEYEIVFTVSKNDISSIKKSASLLKIPIIEIGYVENGQGVFLEKNNELVNLIDKGWRHFKK
jgi:thiamine-monophosphate kinase